MCTLFVTLSILKGKGKGGSQKIQGAHFRKSETECEGDKSNICLLEWFPLVLDTGDPERKSLPVLTSLGSGKDRP